VGLRANDLPTLEAEALVASLAAKGLQVRTFDVRVTPGGARFDFELVQVEARARPQRLAYPVAPHRVSEVSTGRHEAPVALAVALTGNEANVAVILEESASSRVLAPRPFRDLRGGFFWETLESWEASWTLETLTAWGENARAEGQGLTVAGVLRPPVRERCRWSVHLHDCAIEQFAEQPSVKTLASAAQLVEVRAVAGCDGLTVSLWHDRLSEPWPSKEPFASRPPRTRRSPPLELEWSVASVGVPATMTHAFCEVDRLVRGWLEESGARHAQLAVAERGRVALARAYTLAEPGYPRAETSDPIRLGSVSKAFTLHALQRCLWVIGQSLETRLADLPGLSALRGRSLGETHLEDVVCHRAGFPSRPDLRPDDPANPLCEVALARALRGDAAARPGDMTRFLLRGDFDLRATKRAAYSNEGYVFLGEVASLLHTGDPGRYDETVRDLFGLGASPLVGTGLAQARERHESPAHPSLPSWTLDPTVDDAPLLVPYAFRGSFLGPAAGWAVSATETLALLSPRLPVEFRTAREVGTIEPSLGLYVSERTHSYTTSKTRTRSATPVVRLMHSGRLQGGAALFVHQCIFPGHEGASRSILLALNRLHDLDYARVGRPLLAALEPIDLEVHRLLSE
jgi:hypothetical protein